MIEVTWWLSTIPWLPRPKIRGGSSPWPAARAAYLQSGTADMNLNSDEAAAFIYQTETRLGRQVVLIYLKKYKHYKKYKMILSQIPSVFARQASGSEEPTCHSKKSLLCMFFFFFLQSIPKTYWWHLICLTYTVGSHYCCTAQDSLTGDQLTAHGEVHLEKHA